MLRRFATCALLAATLPALAEKKIDPATSAGQYAAHATQEGITIAADPYDRLPKEDVFRVDYLKYNFIPIRIVVTNDTALPISLNDVRILLLPAESGKINAAEPEDVERRVEGAARRGTTIPIGPLKIHKQGKAADSKVEADFSEHEYSALAVEPHTTRAGFLFYDVQGLGQHPLNGAKLVFRQVRDSSGKEMYAFEVPLDAYLAKAPQ
ncbi:hypothetical protein [Acidipila sp. EB88]|uniref:hypothetical protein n=1 Tax=Acidipila sp. EB88 TaxID=2305226 RepID=UPI000F5FC804|nr:hypothetical protein [Acidipila sp. EB88]RRA48629.1 hypothetical protein D1Y84_10365 [Acidipila sp. EB88]